MTTSAAPTSLRDDRRQSPQGAAQAADAFLCELLGDDEAGLLPPRQGSRLHAVREWIAERLHAGRAFDDIYDELADLLRVQLAAGR